MPAEALLRQVVDAQGSDLILREGARPAIRVDGRVRFVSDLPTSAEEARSVFRDVLDARQQEDFTRAGEVDAAFDLPGLGRFRVNAFRQRGRLAFVFRLVKSAIPTLAETQLPAEPLVRLCRLRRGLVLVTGTAGSGKSTTLAAMLDWINRNEERHVITLEDPVEFLFDDLRSTFNQREVGVDTASFAGALKSVVRQAPDVIMVGEIRDLETVESALNAAETGHLVLSTLHTVNAVQTVERILGFFPQHRHDLVRTQLSLLLEGVVSQRLLPRREGAGRVPATELLLATPTVREMLAQGRTRDLSKAIQEGHEHYGTQTFNQSLTKLVRSGRVDVEDALAASDHPDGLKLELRGIVSGSRAGASGFEPASRSGR